MGLVEDLVPTRALRTLITILLFYGKKAILLKWKNKNAPEGRFWKQLVNNMLPYYKTTYRARGCEKKFDKIWKVWWESSNTVG